MYRILKNVLTVEKNSRRISALGRHLSSQSEPEKMAKPNPTVGIISKLIKQLLKSKVGTFPGDNMRIVHAFHVNKQTLEKEESPRHARQ